MLDIKTWIESAGFPDKVADTMFLEPPSYPYCLFLDNTAFRGADLKNCIADRDITIELYTEFVDTDSENKIEKILNDSNYQFEKSRAWIESEKHFQTVYDFNFTEKI